MSDQVKRDERTPIDKAIDAVDEQAAAEFRASLEKRAQLPIDLLTAAHEWPEDAEVTLTASEDPRKPALLLFDEKQLAWRAILLKPGSKWRIVPDRPAVWTPRTR